MELRSFPRLHGRLNCHKEILRWVFQQPPAGLWGSPKLECGSLDLFSNQSLSCVCASWIKSLVYLATSTSKGYNFNADNGDRCRLVSKIYNFGCSSAFSSRALSRNVLCAHLFFAWIYLFININSERHVCDSFEKQKRGYCFLNLSRRGCFGSHRHCYHNNTFFVAVLF